MKLPTSHFTKEQQQFRLEVRDFLQQEIVKGTFTTKCDSWLSSSNPAFSETIGEKGWIGLTWPKKYGGAEKSYLHRYILTEEFLAAGAPVAAHWIADRQSGPLLLRFGTEQQRQFFLPKIASGTCYFAIGLSEPNSGSDLASISTRAVKVDGGWIVNGAKTWTSNAQDAHYMVTLVRTKTFDGVNKHNGLSQMIINLRAEGVTISPINYMTGKPHFNDIFFDNVFVSDEMVVGKIGDGWKQGLAELAFERSGPERILSTIPLLIELVELCKESNHLDRLKQCAHVIANLWSLRNLSIGVAKMLEDGGEVTIAAALVKSIGTKFEQSIPEIARLLIDTYPRLDANRTIDRLMAESILHGPGFTIRGGTSEILVGIVAKGVVTD